MATEWKEYKLGELCDLIGGYAFKSQDFGNYSDKVIKITNINPPIVDASNLVGVNLSKYDYKKLEKYKVTQGDYVLAMTGATIGKLGKIVDDVDYYVNQRVLIFKPIGELVDKNYLFYCLLKNDFKNFILNYVDSETAQANISATTVGLYSCTIPNLQTQQKIAKILSSLDEKIELNNKINENLHAQAQTIFKSWFVDFEPFGGTMPSDWEKGKLSDIVDIIMGQSPKGESYNEIGDGEVFYQGKADFTERFPVRRLYTTEPNRMAEENSVLLSVRAPVGEINVATEKCCIGRGLASIKSKNGQNSYLLYLLYSIQSQFDIFNGEGTVFGSINKSDLGNMNIILPTPEKISQFEKIASQLDEMILTNWNENQKFTQIRDALLPKLMNGELEV